MDLDVLIDGAPAPAITTRLRSATITERAERAQDTIVLAVALPRALVMPPLGASLAVDVRQPRARLGSLYRLGSIQGDQRSGLLTMFGGAIDPGSVLQVPRRADWHDQPLRHIVEQIAGRAGLRANISAELADVRLADAVQDAETDRDFLGRLATRAGGAVIVEDDMLALVGPLETPPATTLVLDPAAEGAWVSWQRGTPGTFEGVTARYLLADGATVASVTVGVAGSRTRHLPTIFPSEPEASLAARSALAESAAGHDSITVQWPRLRPDLHAPAPVRYRSGLPEGFGGDDLLLSEVRHTIDPAAGYSTNTVTRRPKPSSPSP